MNAECRDTRHLKDTPVSFYDKIRAEARRRMIERTRQRLTKKLEEMGRSLEEGLHVAFIADGNRRWAKFWRKKAGEGHKEGVRVIREELLPFIAELEQIKECSLFLLATANLGRKSEELAALDDLLREEKQALIDLAQKYNIRYHHAGATEGLREKGLKMAPYTAEDGSGQPGYLAEMVEATKDNTGLVVNLCINYDTEAELKAAIKKVEAEASGQEMDVETKYEKIKAARWVKRSVDIVLRSGGDKRLSQFLGTRPDDKAYISFIRRKLPGLRVRHLYRLFKEYSDAEQRHGK